MAERIRGIHHCIGAGFTVTDMVFNFIERYAKANNGLRAEDVADLQRHFSERFSFGFDFFETVHHNCMNACECSTGGSLTRATILASLLAACARRAAENAFRIEIEACGESWLDEFFVGFADYIRKHVRPDAEPKLIAAFFDTVETHKASLTVRTLLRQPTAQTVVSSCVRIFADKRERHERAEPLSRTVNDHIGKIRKVAGANAAKTTSDDIRRFLELVPHEAGLAIGVNQFIPFCPD
jgi:hypothetical protein